METQNQVLKYVINTLKIIGALFCLYCFICSLDILSTSFKLLAGAATGKLFVKEIRLKRIIDKQKSQDPNFVICRTLTEL